MDYDLSEDSGQVTHSLFSLYGDYEIGYLHDTLQDMFLDFNLSYQYADHETSRKITALNRIAKGNYYTSGINAQLQLGNNYYIDNLMISPSIITGFGVSRQEEVNETGALSLNMNINENYMHQWNLGAQIMATQTQPLHIQLGQGQYLLYPGVGLRVSRELHDTTVPLTASYASSPSASFSVAGPDIDRTTVTSQFNVNIQPNPQYTPPNTAFVWPEIDLSLYHARATTHKNTTLSGQLSWQW